MKQILSILGMIAFIILFVFLISIGTEKSEIVECKKLEGYSKEFMRYDVRSGAGFFLTKWQNQQCISHGIVIDAYVI